MHRRQLITAAGAAGALGLTARAAAAQPSPTPAPAGPVPERAPWFQISLAQWSLHLALKAGELDNLDFAKKTREDFGIEAVEYVNSFFKPKATDFDYLTEMKTRAADHGVRSLLIMIDGEGDLAAENAGARTQAIANHYKWIVAAAYLGCHSIRVNAAGGGAADEMMKRAADSLVTLADFGKQYDISVIVENHGGLSSDGSWLSGVMRTADHPGVGTLPDFGNFDLGGGRQYDRYKGIEELMPHAKAVSAKSHEFDEQGNEVHTDFERMLAIVKAAGYRGWIGVEYEGSERSEDEGILLTKKLLERVRGE